MSMSALSSVYVKKSEGLHGNLFDYLFPMIYI